MTVLYISMARTFEEIMAVIEEVEDEEGEEEGEEDMEVVEGDAPVTPSSSFNAMDLSYTSFARLDSLR
tara:strand:+ start:990 stop:1193 length:204 start_codon:yes stop_codon:yes gene_type:complete